jgi:hypothetical protein
VWGLTTRCSLGRFGEWLPQRIAKFGCDRLCTADLGAGDRATHSTYAIATRKDRKANASAAATVRQPSSGGPGTSSCSSAMIALPPALVIDAPRPDRRGKQEKGDLGDARKHRLVAGVGHA